MKEKLRDKEWLMGCLDEGMSQRAIARMIGCSTANVTYWIGKHQCEPKEEDNGLINNREWLEDRVNERLSKTEIASQAGCGVSTVGKWLRKFGLRTNPILASDGFDYHDDHNAVDVGKFGFDEDDIAEIRARLSATAREVFDRAYDNAKDREIFSRHVFDWRSNRMNIRLKKLIKKEIRDAVLQQVGLAAV